MEKRFDITDAWNEQTDPENERNETCYAYFKGEYLQKLRVEYANNGYAWFCRDVALRRLGEKAVDRLERAFEEELVGQ